MCVSVVVSVSPTPAKDPSVGFITAGAGRARAVNVYRAMFLVMGLLLIFILGLEAWGVFDDPEHVHLARQFLYNVGYNPMFDLLFASGFGLLMYRLGRGE